MTKKKKKYLIIILGPTGVGKTDLSIDIAKKYNTEIISCDSRQFYKELNIGTAVPSAEQLQDVKHHFIQHLSITDYYNVSNFEQDSLKLLEDIFKDNDIALMTGGSMMFIDAICKGIDFMPDIDIEIREELKQRLENEGLEPLRFELKRLDPDYYNEVDLKNGKRIIRALEVCYQTGKTFTSLENILL
jgi:tRNA dimethylallyltransferase